MDQGHVLSPTSQAHDYKLTRVKESHSINRASLIHFQGLEIIQEKAPEEKIQVLFEFLPSSNSQQAHQQVPPAPDNSTFKLKLKHSSLKFKFKINIQVEIQVNATLSWIQLYRNLRGTTLKLRTCSQQIGANARTLPQYCNLIRGYIEIVHELSEINIKIICCIILCFIYI